ncbi:MAG: radical SAM protein [Alphaproteobacteria bacterium]|nr:radical SAM protein [Alphaproteobacteria bacterium]
MPIYDMPLWRPPSEGTNLILQATLGCSFNACTFCSMYTDKAFRVRALDEVFADIDDAAGDWPDATRVFLADGDALTLPMDHLAAVLDRLCERFADLQRVSCYATPHNLAKKSAGDLARLREKRLSLVYLGIESGSDDILRRIRKGDARLMERALLAADAAGIKVSATVILGLGGTRLWREHIERTAGLINRMAPRYLSTLQLGLDPSLESGFREAFAKPDGVDFVRQDDDGMLAEQALLLERLDPPRPVIFRSNHASNALALAGTLPRDRDKLLAQLRAAQAGDMALRPLASRGF